MDGRAVFVITQAVQLITSDSRYRRMKLEDVIEDILFNLACLQDYFNRPPDDDEEPIQGTGGPH